MTLERIRIITKRDMEHKTRLELFLSLAEEYGELGKELKVENKVFCNSHKQLDEGSKGESVDVFITAAAMMYAVDDDTEVDFTDKRGTSTWQVIEAFKTIAEYLPDVNINTDSAKMIMALAMEIYFCSPDSTLDEFLAYVNKKLDKWESNQLKELGQ